METEIDGTPGEDEVGELPPVLACSDEMSSGDIVSGWVNARRRNESVLYGHGGRHWRWLSD